MEPDSYRLLYELASELGERDHGISVTIQQVREMEPDLEEIGELVRLASELSQEGPQTYTVSHY
jgi:hypothetical protein